MQLTPIAAIDLTIEDATSKGNPNVRLVERASFGAGPGRAAQIRQN